MTYAFSSDVSEAWTRRRFPPVSCCVRRRTRRSVSQLSPSLCRAVGLLPRAQWTPGSSEPEGDKPTHVTYSIHMLLSHPYDTTKQSFPYQEPLNQLHLSWFHLQSEPATYRPDSGVMMVISCHTSSCLTCRMFQLSIMIFIPILEQKSSP